LISENIFALYPSSGTERTSLPELCTALLDEQKTSWPLLREGWNTMQNCSTREIACDGFSVCIQHNPKRLISTAAKTDEQSISERICFLCSENLPPEQKGILYQDTFFILGNPLPIFPQHFTVVHKKHIPQSFDPFIDDFLSLSAAIGPALTLFYNGPRCGASAPDHLHFQACSSGIIPVEHDIVNESQKLLLKTIGGVALSTLKNYGRGIIILESIDMRECAKTLRRCINVMQELCNNAEEPMMNILSLYSGKKWSVVIFPRHKHRPSVYFADDRVVISPAAVDLGGLIIAPMERDFKSINADLVGSIYREVGVSTNRIQKYIENI
jgi:ATP adenylyltransferase/5',5'''-P-1,P-4-tetraphosphate phosphorylase II